MRRALLAGLSGLTLLAANGGARAADRRAAGRRQTR